MVVDGVLFAVFADVTVLEGIAVLCFECFLLSFPKLHFLAFSCYIWRCSDARVRLRYIDFDFAVSNNIAG